MERDFHRKGDCDAEQKRQMYTWQYIGGTNERGKRMNERKNYTKHLYLYWGIS